MARVKNAKKITKAKKTTQQKKKNELRIAPRLRLEPRLTPKSTKEIKNIQDQETGENSQYFEGNSIQEETSFEDQCVDMRDYDEQRNEVNTSVKENMSYDEIPNPETNSPRKNNEIEENSSPQEMTEKKKRRIKTAVCKGLSWNDRELMDLTIGLQAHGFSDIKKIADSLKTKTEKEIRHFMKLRCVDARKNKSSNKQRGRPVNKWTTLCPENLASWPNIRKWRRLAYDQMLLYTRSKDYSKPVITALCKRFYEEEEEPADPQVINIKLIYKYMMDCMKGEIPPQLPPKESSLVLDLLREVRLMPIAYDFEEERKFLQDFKTATKFKPFEVKNEFKKKFKKEEPEDEIFSPNAVSVPEEVFLDLSRHKRLTQSFNPLVTPVWMLQKEQEYVEKYIEESNVYVD